jgi:hypothetical protein
MNTIRHSKTWLALLLACGTSLPGNLFAQSQPSINLARPIEGATLEAQLPGKPAGPNPAAENALLRDDDPLGFSLPAGTTQIVVSLGKIELINRFNFLNLSAAGKVSVAVTSAKLDPDSPQWHEVAHQEFAEANGVVSCGLGSVEAKYVRVTFDVPAEGRVDTFGLYGQRTRDGQALARSSAAASKNDSGTRYLMLNFAADNAKGGVVMVSPSEDLNAAQKMADGDISTTYTFLPTDPAPMAVIDLGETRPVARVSAAFKAGDGRLSIYLVADPALEGKTSAPDATGPGDAKTIGDVVAKDFPGTRTPVLAVDTGKPAGLNRVSANINDLKGRYVVMMFHPTGSVGATVDADFKDRDAKDFKDVDYNQAPATLQQPLEVAEISALGPLGPGIALTTTPFDPPATVPVTKPPAPTGPPVFPPSSGNGAVSP